jgi:hypothetical protein
LNEVASDRLHASCHTFQAYGYTQGGVSSNPLGDIVTN